MLGISQFRLVQLYIIKFIIIESMFSGIIQFDLNIKQYQKFKIMYISQTKSIRINLIQQKKNKSKSKTQNSEKAIVQY